MPEDFVLWLSRVASSAGLWLQLSRPGQDIAPVSQDQIKGLQFQGSSDEGSLIYIGSVELNGPPTFRFVCGRREIDFVSSYAIQILPPIFIEQDEVLLQGVLAIMAKENYSDTTRYSHLRTLYKSLCGTLEAESDKSYVVVQPISAKPPKIWKDMLVGPGLGQRSDIRLKQFAKGPVEFYLGEARLLDRSGTNAR